jgi:hypothetical protein
MLKKLKYTGMRINKELIAPSALMRRREFFIACVITGSTIIIFNPLESLSATIDIFGIPVGVTLKGDEHSINKALSKLEPWERELLRSYLYLFSDSEPERIASNHDAESYRRVIRYRKGVITPELCLHEIGHIINWIIIYTESEPSWAMAVFDAAGERAYGDLGGVLFSKTSLPMEPYTSLSVNGETRDLNDSLRTVLKEIGKTEDEFRTGWKTLAENNSLFENVWDGINKRNGLQYSKPAHIFKYRKRGFVSWRASQNINEDVAETFALLRTNPEKLEKLAKKEPAIYGKVSLLQESLDRLKALLQTDEGRKRMELITIRVPFDSSGVQGAPG